MAFAELPLELQEAVARGLSPPTLLTFAQAGPLFYEAATAPLRQQREEQERRERERQRSFDQRYTLKRLQDRLLGWVFPRSALLPFDTRATTLPALGTSAPRAASSADNLEPDEIIAGYWQQKRLEDLGVTRGRLFSLEHFTPEQLRQIAEGIATIEEILIDHPEAYRRALAAYIPEPLAATMQLTNPALQTTVRPVSTPPITEPAYLFETLLYWWTLYLYLNSVVGRNFNLSTDRLQELGLQQLSSMAQYLFFEQQYTALPSFNLGDWFYSLTQDLLPGVPARRRGEAAEEFRSLSLQDQKRLRGMLLRTLGEESMVKVEDAIAEALRE